MGYVSIIHPREIFKEAFRKSATFIICFTIHPVIHHHPEKILE
ncbi:JAB domain-containing protein [Siminovitchia fordii]